MMCHATPERCGLTPSRRICKPLRGCFRHALRALPGGSGQNGSHNAGALRADALAEELQAPSGRRTWDTPRVRCPLDAQNASSSLFLLTEEQGAALKRSILDAQRIFGLLPTLLPREEKEEFGRGAVSPVPASQFPERPAVPGSLSRSCRGACYVPLRRRLSSSSRAHARSSAACRACASASRAAASRRARSSASAACRTTVA